MTLWGSLAGQTLTRKERGRGRSPGPRTAALGAWPVQWALYGRRGGVAGPLGPEWPPWGRGRSPGPRLKAVGAWGVTWAPDGRRGDVAGPLGPGRLPWCRVENPGECFGQFRTP